MAGQTHHFRQYAPALIKDQRQIAYGVRRYTDETNRLYGVLNTRLADRDYVAGDYSIADMAIWPWILPGPQGQDLEAFPASEGLDGAGRRPAGGSGRQGGRKRPARRSRRVRKTGRSRRERCCSASGPGKRDLSTGLRSS